MSNKLIIVILLYLVALYVTCIYYDNKCVKLEERITSKQNKIISLENELYEAKNEIKIKEEKISDLNFTLEDVKVMLNNYMTIIEDVKRPSYKMVYLGDFKLTHYCVETFEHICGTGTGLTATGTNVAAGRTIAVDPSIIPYGTEVYIEGYGWRIAEDCGGAVNGNQIDIAVDTHELAESMGTLSGGVWILVQ